MPVQVGEMVFLPTRLLMLVQMLVQVRTIIKFENGGTNLARYKSHYHICDFVILLVFLLHLVLNRLCHTNEITNTHTMIPLSFHKMSHQMTDNETQRLPEIDAFCKPDVCSSSIYSIDFLLHLNKEASTDSGDFDYISCIGCDTYVSGYQACCHSFRKRTFIDLEKW
ncbi:hypothetical protein LXL04_015121 [Taraxacum kok-saghyz]